MTVHAHAYVSAALGYVASYIQSYSPITEPIVDVHALTHDSIFYLIITRPEK